MKRKCKTLFSSVIALAFILTGCATATPNGEGSDIDSVQTTSSSKIGSSENKSSSSNDESRSSSTSESSSPNNVDPNIPESSDTEVMKMNIQIGDAHFTATLEDNAAVHELIDMMRDKPVTIKMNDYSGFEKVGPLGRSLTTDNHQTTTSAGDIVLYNGNQIVIFYGSNSWSYTRIGRIDDLSGWEKALGKGSITAVFSI